MRGAFWRGVCVGWLLSALLLAGSAAVVARRGLTVTVDAAGLGARVEAEVREHVRRELPAALAHVRAQLPPIVAREVSARLAAGRVNLGPVELEIPPSMQGEIERRLTAALTEAGGRFLGQVDQAQAADRIAREARVLVEQRLFADLEQYRLVVQPVPWLTVPVHVRAR